MLNAKCDIHEETRLWPEYRRAFAEFSQKAHRVQMLSSLNPKPQELFDAARELEMARRNYSLRRDALAQLLLPSKVQTLAAACS
jgi:hypothetical protein